MSRKAQEGQTGFMLRNKTKPEIWLHEKLKKKNWQGKSLKTINAVPYLGGGGGTKTKNQPTNQQNNK